MMVCGACGGRGCRECFWQGEIPCVICALCSGVGCAYCGQLGEIASPYIPYPEDEDEAQES